MKLHLLAASVWLLVWAAASPVIARPPTIQEEFQRTVLKKVVIGDVSPFTAFTFVARAGVARLREMAGIAGGISVVLAGDLGESVSVSYSSENESLETVIASLCNKYGWEFYYTEFACIVGPKPELEKFRRAYGPGPVKKDEFVLPKVVFGEVAGREAAAFLTKKAEELPSGGNRKITYSGVKGAEFNLYTEDVPLAELLRLLAASTGQRSEDAFRVEAGEVRK